MPHPPLVTLLVGAIAISACATLSPRQDEKGEQPGQNQRSPEHVPPHGPAIPRQDQEPGIQAPQTQEQADKMDIGSLADWAMVGISLLAVLVAAKTYSAVIEQSSATSEAARAATRSADIAKTAMRSSQRARLIMEQASFDPIGLVDTGKIVVRLLVTNGGKSSAQMTGGGVHFVTGNPDDVPDSPSYSRGHERDTLWIAPGQSSAKHPTVTIASTEHRRSLLEGTSQLLFYGFFSYRDDMLEAGEPDYRTAYGLAFNAKTKEIAFIAKSEYNKTT